MNTPETIRSKISEVIRAKQHALEKMESVLSDPAASPAALDEAQSEVDHLTAQWNRLIHELRVVQFESPERFGTHRNRAGQRPMREQILDLLDELGVPSSPRVVSEYAFACLGIELPIARFASLRRDEERGYTRDSSSKPAWVVPALNSIGFAPIPRLVAISVWPIERRLIGPRTLRVNHLKTLLALIGRVATLGPDQEATRRILALIFRFARSVPGAGQGVGEPDLAQIRSAAESELLAIGPTDDIERMQAAERLAKLPLDRQIWGLPPMIKREPQVDYKVSG